MSKKTLLPLLYIFYITSIFLIGQIKPLGLPINFNIIFTILLFIFCFATERKLYTDKLLNYYWLFIAFYGLSALVTGYFIDFFHFLYSSVLMAYIAYWSTIIVARNYNINTILPYNIILIGVFASIVTISQGMGIPIENQFVDALTMNKNSTDDFVYNGYDWGFALSGIYLSPVINGRYLLFFFLISLLLIKNKYNIIYIIITTIILVGIFICQQRSAFYLSLFSLSVLILKYKSKSKVFKYVYLGTIIISIMVLLPYFLDYLNTSGSRLTENSGTGREEIWPVAIDFYLSNPIFAGNRLFMEITHMTSHNLLLSAFIAGGFLGGIILSVFVIRLISKSIKTIFGKYNNYNSLVISLMIFSLIGDSMVHNFGFVQADLPMFIALALYYIFIENNNTFDNIS